MENDSWTSFSELSRVVKDCRMNEGEFVIVPVNERTVTDLQTIYLEASYGAIVFI
jgi:hypothetical protein